MKNIKFIQHIAKLEKAPSTWDTANGINWDTMHKKTNFYVNRFKRGVYDIDKNKANLYVTKLKFLDQAGWYNWLSKEEIAKQKKELENL